MTHKQTALAKPALVSSLFFLFHWGAIGAFEPFINVYFLNRGLSAQQVGWLAAFLPIATLVVAPLVSMAADATGRRVLILRLFLLLVVLCCLLLSATTTVPVFIALMALFAIARAPVIAISDSLVAQLALQHDLSFGNLRLWGSLSFAGIAVGAGWLWQQFGYDYMFLTAMIIFIPAVWVLGGLRDKKRPQQASPSTAVETYPNGSIIRLLGIILTTAVAGIALGFAFIFDGIYMDQLGGDELMIGLMFSLAALCELPAMSLTSSLLRRYPGRRVLLVSFLVLGFSFAGYIFAATPAVLLLFGAGRGLGFGIFLVSSIHMVSTAAPERWHTTAQSLRQAATFGLAMLIAGPLGGFLLDGYGARVLFVTGLVILLVACLLLLVTQKPQQIYHSRPSTPRPPQQTPSHFNSCA